MKWGLTYFSMVAQHPDDLEYRRLNVHHKPSRQGIARPCTPPSEYPLAERLCLRCLRCTVWLRDLIFGRSPQSTA